MSFCKGRTFIDILNHPKLLTAANIIQIYIAVARSLDEIHGQGVVHNDFKEDNVLIEENTADGSFTAHIIDFGLSTAVGELTNISGSPSDFPFYAPEILAGHPCHPKADVFSLGFTLNFVTETLLSDRHLKAWPPGTRQLFLDMLQQNPVDLPDLCEVIRRLESSLQQLICHSVIQSPPYIP
ncbi:sperm motility kinase 2B-like [Homarus americanus]|uniref:sperm motility kinase 2B-like n=1 Tax=Homarus americanus TaxID=6706 RepID=UPI001C440AA2|nr:sperm motility kinase 2B-like [Homarus americanus]